MGRKPNICLEKALEVLDFYRSTNPEYSVREIARRCNIPYKRVYKYMNKVIESGGYNFTMDNYLKLQSRKNSMAKQGKKNPNYNGKLVTKEYRNNLSKAMTGKTIPQSVRNQISETKKNGNGNGKKTLTDKI